MKNIKKKIFNIFIVSLCLMICFPMNVNAKTLRELQEELEKTKAEQSNNSNKKKLTEDEIVSKQNQVTAATNEINKINEDMNQLNKEISALEKDIAEKDGEIKRIVNYVEISSGGNQYLEYLLGAQDFTDFIYRAAVAEQLSNYNEDLINEFTAMVEANNKKKEELAAKQKSLEEKQVQLAADIAALNEEVTVLNEVSISLADEIKMQKEVIQVYLDRGCGLDQDITTCGRATLPTTTAFYRPLASGYVTSEFSSRCYTNAYGKYVCDFHAGTDFSNSDNNWQPVYAIGTGLVVNIWYQYWCGGNMVFIQHKMSDGSTYTSGYFHLRQVNVSVGDTVTRDTVVGIMGGDPGREYWDSCSTGSHAHVQIATGLYMTDYTAWSEFTARSFDLRSIVNIPWGQYNWFYDRISVY